MIANHAMSMDATQHPQHRHQQTVIHNPCRPCCSSLRKHLAQQQQLTLRHLYMQQTVNKCICTHNNHHHTPYNPCKSEARSMQTMSNTNHDTVMVPTWCSQAIPEHSTPYPDHTMVHQHTHCSLLHSEARCIHCSTRSSAYVSWSFASSSTLLLGRAMAYMLSDKLLFLFLLLLLLLLL
jgi:hypothetical protein